MSSRAQQLAESLSAVLGPAARRLTVALGEVTLVVGAGDLRDVMLRLRDHADFRFDSLIDVCGVDYSTYGDVGNAPGERFASVYHLLSTAQNQRLRVRAFAPDDEFPVLPSVVDLWPSANWFERESFDLFGIIYEGHPDLRRILTDYGFIGHPFRKDFPVSGHVEMIYDVERKQIGRAHV